MRDIVRWNSIITGYGRKGEIYEARKCLELIRKEGVEPCLVTWNVSISSFNQLGKHVKLLKEMEDYGILADVFT